MPRTNVKIFGNTPKEKLESIFDQCSNNNQICFHIKRHPDIILFLKNEINLDLPLMVLLYHYKENIKEIINSINK